MTRMPLLFACASMLAIGAPALAMDTGAGASAGARAGSLGYGPEGRLQLTDRIAMRVSVTQANFAMDEVIDEIAYDLDMELGAGGAQFDYYPFKRGLYASFGLFSNSNSATLIGTPDQPTTIGTTVYQPAEIGVISGEVLFDDVATFAGLGVSSAVLRSRIEMYAEAGAYFQGAPQLTYSASGLLAFNEAFLADLDAEAAKVEDDLSVLEVYPAASIGMRVRF